MPQRFRFKRTFFSIEEIGDFGFVSLHAASGLAVNKAYVDAAVTAGSASDILTSSNT